jgi:holo-[acyl-carrier protein] synthase
MIVGIGIDLVHIPRIEQALKRWGERFTHRVFTPEETAYCLKHRDRAQSMALRFAAKEACSKALGTGMRMGIAWRQMAIAHEPSGKPVLRLSDAALRRARELGSKTWHVSLSHEKEYATAIVILSR